MRFGFANSSSILLYVAHGWRDPSKFVAVMIMLIQCFMLDLCSRVSKFVKSLSHVSCLYLCRVNPDVIFLNFLILI